MRQFYDMILLGLFIVVICVFMVCCQKRTQQINERNAKIFEMRAVSPGDTELEYEDIQSSEMDNDNNDDIELIEKQKKISIKKKKNKNILIDSIELQNNKCNKLNNEIDENKTDGDIFSDSTEDEMSMERMREEYYKSQTLTKKFTDLLDDIRDILKSKQQEVQRKFTKKEQMIVVPMAMPSKSTNVHTTLNNSNNNNNMVKHKKKSKKNKLNVRIQKVDNKNSNVNHLVDDEKVREEDD
eukprot:124371_1